MRSLRNIASLPKGVALVADDVTEFHAARLLLLLRLCGTAGRIDGLTKLAKLDFFVRYPDFFARLARHLGQPVEAATSAVESAMVRHHYGPWDKRYYQVLPFLISRSAIAVEKERGAYVFRLTDLGKVVAKKLADLPEYGPLVEQMKRVKKLVGRKSGSHLKNLIYDLFAKEVRHKPLGEIIS